jgi:hypothetical protein
MIGPFIEFLTRLPRASISFSVNLCFLMFGGVDTFLDYRLLIRTSVNSALPELCGLLSERNGQILLPKRFQEIRKHPPARNIAERRQL